jgi:hypothetical protein
MKRKAFGACVLLLLLLLKAGGRGGRLCGWQEVSGLGVQSLAGGMFGSLSQPVMCRDLRG